MSQTGSNGGSKRLRAILAARLVSCLLLLGAATAGAEELRVATSGDYAPFSVLGDARESPVFDGFDPAVARAYAADRGLELRWVRFRWPELLADLAANRFDVAMSGVTVRPQRSVAGRFSVPVATSGAVALVGGDHRGGLAALDDPAVRIAVNPGGHLERVARLRFPRARFLVIPDNDAVLPALLAGRAAAAVTDTLEAPHWLSGNPDLRLLGPFTSDRKAYLVAPGRPDLAADLDSWLLDREADGTLAVLRRRHLGQTTGTATADPFSALLAAIDERLALMPLVAETKRRSGGKIEDAVREARVISAAWDATRRAAAAIGVRPPEEDAVRALFEAQISAAKAIQRSVLAAEPDPSLPVLDLRNDLRPALLRIGNRIAWLVVRLPPDVTRERASQTARSMLQRRELDADAIEAIARAVAGVSESQERVSARTISVGDHVKL